MSNARAILLKLIRSLFIVAFVLNLAACQTLEHRSERVQKTKAPVLVNRLQLKTVWKKSTGTVSKPWLRLPLAENKQTLFSIGEKGLLVAVDKKTGQKKWERQIPFSKQSLSNKNNKNDKFITAGPAADANLVVVASRNGQIHGLSAKTGQIQWSNHLLAESLANPLIAGDCVCVVSLDSAVHALSAKDGRILWKQVGIAPSIQLRRAAQPQLIDSQIVVGLANGTLTSFNAKTGLINWEKEISEPKGDADTDRMVDIAADFVYSPQHPERLFVSAYQGTIQALSSETGEKLWERSDLSTYSSLGVNRSSLLIADLQGRISSLSVQDGKTQWQQTALMGRIFSPPLYLEKLQVWVLGDDEGYLQALSTKGELLARWQLGSQGIEAAPIVDGDLLFVLTRAGLVHALQLQH